MGKPNRVSQLKVESTLGRLRRCRVGGGIRTEEAALYMIERFGAKVILGTAATPDLLSRLPREKVIAAVDSVDGRVMGHGWTVETDDKLEERIEALTPYVGGFLVTFIEREGRMVGSDLERMARLVDLAGDVRITFAGGITTPEEVAAIDRIGADAQVGMALYSGRMNLGEAIAAPLLSDRMDGLVPTVVYARNTHSVLGLVYSSKESVRETVATGYGVYHSRKRGLWMKGATSGNTHRVHEIQMDCDRDALVFVVDSEKPFCHLGTPSCFVRGGS